MASFELARVGSVAEIARESRVGRFLPIYVAAIVAGAALGIGLLTAVGTTATVPHESAVVSFTGRFSAAVQGLAEVRSVEPARPAPPVDVTNASLLPVSWLGVFEPPPAPEAAAPAQPVAAPAVAAAPAAPAAPVQAAAPAQPVAAPTPAPALQPPPAAPAAQEPPAATGKPNFYVPPVSSGGITELEQRLLTGIDAERANAGLPAYAFDAGLSRVARTRVQQLVDEGYFAHVDPFGYSMYTELLAYFGYRSYAWAGENLAMNNYALAESPERAVVSLMKSPTHRANLLASDFNRIGIGELTTADGRHFYAMIFIG